MTKGGSTLKKTTLTLAAGALASLMLAGTAAGDHVRKSRTS